MSKLVWLLSVTGVLALADSAIPEPAVSATFHIRLDSPLTSYNSPAGTAFTATVISPLEVDGQLVIPLGSVIHGTVSRISAVGFGLVHERATLELAFHEYELADGNRYKLGARLEFIENAREQVDARGRIRGVLAASSPQGLLRGIWYRPSVSFFHRSAIGLTGLGGSLWSRFSLGPAGAAGMLAARYIAFPLPEPEIQLPPGTEMRVLAISFPKDAPTTLILPDLEVEPSLARWLQTHSRVVTKPNGTAVADVINLAFIGGVEELQDAFTAAGWVSAEPLSLHAVSTAYRAFNSMSGYSTAPVSMLLYQRAEPVVVFQKSFNTIAKRHHIRIWRAGVFDGSAVWLGAATHDAGVRFQLASMKISHRIDPRTDLERKKVVTDLSFAGCSEGLSFLDRSSDVTSARNLGIQTDGRVAVMDLQKCEENAPHDHFANDVRFPSPGSRTKRIVRRFVLETRQYFLRDNMYYWVYRGAAAGIKRVSTAAPLE